METSAKSRYLALVPRREPFLQNARDAAALTVPSLMPPKGHTGTLPLPQPYSGHGARCVLNLSSRLLTALLPPGASVFKFGVPAEVLAEAQAEKVPAELETQLALAEKITHGEVERRGWRQPTHVALQHLIVCGNALEQSLPDNTIRAFRLDQYVVVRDPVGNLVELVIEEMLAPAALREPLRALVANRDDVMQTVGLYTWLRREGDTWSVQQELEDQLVRGSQGRFVHAAFPFRALRWAAVLGEDYGRGKVEEHIADFRALNGLTKAVIEGAAMASRNVTMIRPNAAGGMNLRRRLAEAGNGSFVVGNPEDVTMLQFTNKTGMQFTSAEVQALKLDLAAAFLLGSAMRRDAERVTAFELRQVVEELEGALGGVYSTLAQEMMGPRVSRLILQMQSNAQLPAWPQGSVEPTVLTGLEALGREQDVNRVATALDMIQPLTPEAQAFVEWEALLRKGFAGLGLADAVRKRADVERERQALAQAQAAQAVAPIAAQAMADQATQQSAQ
jgi:hypothetical protein